MKTVSRNHGKYCNVCIPDEYLDYERLNSINKIYAVICQLKEHEVADSEG